MVKTKKNSRKVTLKNDCKGFSSIFLMLGILLVIGIIVTMGLIMYQNNSESKSFFSRLIPNFLQEQTEFGTGEIIGDSVITDDSKVYIKTTPAIVQTGLGGKENITFEVMSKIYSGDVNLVYGFDTENVKPKNAYYYKPHNVTKSYTCDDYFNYTTNPNHFWCYKEYYNENTTQTEYDLKFERDFESGDIENKIAYWNETEDYKKINDVFTKVNQDYDGFDTWYYIQGLNINQDQMYKLKVEMEFNEPEGKYGFAIYPSDETISEAISNNHFYYQDPYWNSSMENELYAWYPFDETSGTTAEDVHNGTHNGTYVNTPTLGIESPMGTAVEFTASSTEHINLGIKDIGSEIDDGITISFWVNTTSTARFIYGGYDGTQNFNININHPSAGLMQIFTQSTGNKDSQADSCANGSINDGGSHHVVIIIDPTASDLQFFIDNKSSTCSTSYEAGGTWANFGKDLYWGCRNHNTDSPAFCGDATTDELAIWTRVLSRTEISNLYLNLTYQFGGSDASPEIAIITPVNNTNFTTPAGDFICNATDDVGILNASLYIDGVRNKTELNTSVGQLNLTLHIPLNFTDGGHNYTCDVYDTSNVQGTNYTRDFNIDTSTIINILFSNKTDRTTYKSVFDEGENFYINWNYTDPNGTALNNTQAQCNFTAFDVVIETEAVTSNFDLCDTGKGCDQANPLTESFTMHVSNTTEDVIRDFLMIEICHANLIQRDVQVSFECGVVTDTKIINQTQFGLCSGGFSSVLVPTTACMNSLKVNITLDNNANVYTFRHNISEWELDRELTKHTDTYADGDVIFNATTQLWMGTDNYERYSHGQVRVDVNCTLNQSVYYNNDTSENITIVNTPPTITDGQVTIGLINYNLNVTTAILNYQSGNWSWKIPIIDDDIFNHNLTWYNSSGDVLKSTQHLGSQTTHNTTNATFLNFLTENTYNLTVWANDTNGNLTQRSFNFNVTDTTLPILTVPANQSLYNNQSLGVQFTATDNIAISGFQDNWTTIFTINSSGYLINSSAMFPTTFFINVSVNDTSNNKDSAIFQVFVKSNTSLTIYDEFNDTTVNTTLWNAVYAGGTNTSLIENKNYMRMYGYTNDAGDQNVGASLVYSKLLPTSLINVEKIELKSYLDAAYDDDGDTTGSSKSRLIVLGNTILEIKANVTTENPTADFSVWTFEKNTTKGNTWYEVYNDAVWNQSINGTDTNVTIYTYYDDETSGVIWADARLYYVYYSMGEGAVTITTNSPANNTAYLNTETVTFNITSSTSIGNLTNMTLYINDVVNETKVLTLNSSENIYTKNFSIGSYTWFTQSCNDNGGCSNSTRRNITVSSYKENTLTYNATTVEGSKEAFTLSITTNGSAPTSAFLSYNNTLYAATITNPAANNYSITKSLTIPLGSGIMPLYFNFDIGGTDYNTTSYNQTVSATIFGLCNASLTVPYVNYTFQDEGNASTLTGTIPASTFYYWTSVQNTNKSLSYTNTTGVSSYAFCYSPSASTINVFSSIQYAATGYPARTNKDTVSYTNTTTNKILYLTHTDDGIYVTFQVINLAEQAVSGVYANATLVSSGAVVGSGYTDAAGSITYWLDPDNTYTFHFTKSGTGNYTTSLQPTQTSYTVQLGISSSVNSSKSRGVTYFVKPLDSTLFNNSDVIFNLTLASSYWTVTEFGFSISNGTDTLSSNSSSGNGGIVTLTQNTGNNSNIIMNYYYVIDGTYTNYTKVWYVLSSGGTDWSLSVFFTDLTTYLGTGLFGLTNFGLGLIIFLFIFVAIGLMSYKFGIVNPAAISVMLFMLVLFFDVGLGLLENINPVGAIPYFPTFFIGIIMSGLLIREVYK